MLITGAARPQFHEDRDDNTVSTHDNMALAEGVMSSDGGRIVREPISSRCFDDPMAVRGAFVQSWQRPGTVWTSGTGLLYALEMRNLFSCVDGALVAG